MTTNAQRESATIYQFPVGGRAGRARGSLDKAPGADSLPTITYGGSWYHDDAIREAAEAARKTN